jgi:hypothetical protein
MQRFKDCKSESKALMARPSSYFKILSLRLVGNHIFRIRPREKLSRHCPFRYIWTSTITSFKYTISKSNQLPTTPQCNSTILQCDTTILRISIIKHCTFTFIQSTNLPTIYTSTRDNISQKSWLYLSSCALFPINFTNWVKSVLITVTKYSVMSSLECLIEPTAALIKCTKAKCNYQKWLALTRQNCLMAILIW